MKIGSDIREADIIVYNNDERIVVEYKKVDVFELEFKQSFSCSGGAFYSSRTEGRHRMFG